MIFRCTRPSPTGISLLDELVRDRNGPDTAARAHPEEAGPLLALIRDRESGFLANPLGWK